MTLIREIAKNQKAKEVFFLGNSIKVKALSKVEKIAKFDMAEAIKHFSKIDPLENYIYIMTPFARIIIDEEEQALFKNSQEKFDAYLNEKQSVKGIDHQVIPETIISNSGISSIVFVDAGRYLIVPKTITRVGTNQAIKDASAINGEHKMNYTSYISRKIGELISMTTDKDIKARYLKLKEAVDYSNNISTQATLNADQLMCSQLDELAHLTLADTTGVIILEKIDAVEMTWKMRSNMSSSVR
jgi:hypothetical protein